MIDYDYCLCATEDCPRYDICVRGGGVKHEPGIHTVSYFGTMCNEENGYMQAIEVENGNRSND